MSNTRHASNGADGMAPPITIISPSKGWHLWELRELWLYRELWWVLTRRDTLVRYKQTFIGAGWAILQPLAMMVVFTMFFGRMAKIPSDAVPYPVFSYCGLLPWLFFANTLGSIANSLPNNASLITKIYFPRLILPLSSVGLGLLDWLVGSSLLVVMMLWYGLTPGLTLLLMPGIMLGIVLFVVGVGSALCALNVAFRDFRYVIPLLTQLWMFATPVVYPARLVPTEYRWVLAANPMAAYVEAMRAAAIGQPMDTSGLVVAFITSLVAFAAGTAIFSRAERRFADII